MDDSKGTVDILPISTNGQRNREMVADVRRGLGAREKWLPPKYFYDAHGSELFERITELEEYYLTRSETALLEEHAEALVVETHPDEIIEIGAGSSRKNQLLLQALGRVGGRGYAPIDVSRDALRVTADNLEQLFPWLQFRGFVGDFEKDLLRIPRNGRRLVAFLGSTIGNLDEDQRVRFLSVVREMLKSDEGFLMGVDLMKSRARLERAYNDDSGVTAAFNKNVLAVLNRELDGDLPLDAFDHQARYNRDKERIEMYLVARRACTARFAAGDLEVRFEEGEHLRTEISCKFRKQRVEGELRRAGLRLDRWLEDAAGDFALVLARPAKERVSPRPGRA